VRTLEAPADLHPGVAAGLPTRIAPVNSALVNAVLLRDPRLAGRQGSPPAIPSVEQMSSPHGIYRINKPYQARTVINKSSDKDPRLSKTDTGSCERTKKSSKAKSESPVKSKKSSRSSRCSPERRSSDRGKKSPRKSEDSHSSKRSSPREKKRSTHSSRSEEKPSLLQLDDESDVGDANDKEKAPSPPPPPVISDKGKSDWPVNYTKGTSKGRNWRRNRDDSPDVALPSAATLATLADKKTQDDPAKPDKSKLTCTWFSSVLELGMVFAQSVILWSE